MDTKGVSARQLYEAKRKAMVYYQENGVPGKMEEILNTMFYDQPADVFGHLVTYFQKFARTPVITKLQPREVLDSRGQPTIQTDIYCSLNNQEKCLAASISSSENYEPEHALQDDKDTEEAERQKNVDKALELLQGSLMKVVVGQDPSKQAEIDTNITKTIEELKNEEDQRLAKDRLDNAEAETEASRPQSVASAKKGGPKSAKPTSVSRMSRMGVSNSRMGMRLRGKGKGGAAVVVIPDEPREKLFPGSNAISALSKAVCEAGAVVASKPVYKHIAALKHGSDPGSFVMPLPVVTIISGGRAYPGKCNCVKEYMLVPKPGMALKESMKMMNNIYTSVTRSLTSKAGVSARLVSDCGALCPALEKPEMALDLIQEALTALELTPGKDVHFILNCGLQECFDFEKGKYEVMTGVLKSGEDLIEYWADLKTRYPAIIGLIDPMRKQDKESWMKLCEKISDQCLVIGDVVYHRPGLLKNEEIAEDFKTSGTVFKIEMINSISDILEASKKMEEADNTIMMTTSVGESPDTFLVELAVGAGAKFVKLGAPCRGERVMKMNRLIQIEAELESEGLLGSQQAHAFPHIEPPPPPPEEEGEGAEKDESPAKKK